MDQALEVVSLRIDGGNSSIEGADSVGAICRLDLEDGVGLGEARTDGDLSGIVGGREVIVVGGIDDGGGGGGVRGEEGGLARRFHGQGTAAKKREGEVRRTEISK